MDEVLRRHNDPNGLDMTRDNRDRLAMFAKDNVEVRRLALNFDQVEQYGPPPNPAKDDTGKRRIKPYDPTVGKQIADMLRPSLGNQIPSAPGEIAAAFGRGWWRPDPQAAQELLERAGFTKRDGKWQTPDGKPFSIRITVEGESRPVMTRAGSMIAQQWQQFGIDAATVVAQGTLADRRAAGDFQALISWSVETWGGHPDLSFFLDSWHSQFVAALGKPQPPRNWQ